MAWIVHKNLQSSILLWGEECSWIFYDYKKEPQNNGLGLAPKVYKGAFHTHMKKWLLSLFITSGPCEELRL